MQNKGIQNFSQYLEKLISLVEERRQKPSLFNPASVYDKGYSQALKDVQYAFKSFIGL